VGYVVDPTKVAKIAEEDVIYGISIAKKNKVLGLQFDIPPNAVLIEYISRPFKTK
jgi:hypothetical protein